MDSALADAVVVVHLAFVVFVVFGGWLAVRWPRLAWLHVPAFLWGAWIEFSSGICPLTPLENRLRAAAGEAGYGGGFVEHYLVPVLYPPGLTSGSQQLLGVLLVTFNAVAYALLVRRVRARSGRGIGRSRS